MKKPSSTVSHKAAGRKQSLVWFEGSDHDKIKAAADIRQEPVTTFIAAAAIERAEKFLEKNKKTT